MKSQEFQGRLKRVSWLTWCEQHLIHAVFLSSVVLNLFFLYFNNVLCLYATCVTLRGTKK